MRCNVCMLFGLLKQRRKKREISSCVLTFETAMSSCQMYHHQQQLQSHSHFLSSRQTFPPERHMLLQGGSIPAEPGLVLSTDAKPSSYWPPIKLNTECPFCSSVIGCTMAMDKPLEGNGSPASHLNLGTQTNK